MAARRGCAAQEEKRSPTRTIAGNPKVRSITAENVSIRGWSWSCVSAVDREWGAIWIVDEPSRRKADEKLAAFLEIKSAVEPFSAFSFL
jgi:hypothetical protein